MKRGHHQLDSRLSRWARAAAERVVEAERVAAAWVVAAAATAAEEEEERVAAATAVVAAVVAVAAARGRWSLGVFLEKKP